MRENQEAEFRDIAKKWNDEADKHIDGELVLYCLPKNQ